MLINYLKIAWRHLTQNKGQSFLNIMGLSVGLTVTMLIGLWIWSEFAFDRNFEHYDRIAQVMQTQTLNGTATTGKGNVMPLGAALRKSYGSDFRHVVLSSWSMNSVVGIDKGKHIDIQGNYMEPDAPDMLSLTMLSGTRHSFRDHATVLLSQSTAKALFGSADAIGKAITIDGGGLETVTGVYADFPVNSSFSEVKFIAPFLDLTTWVNGNENNWYNESFQVFVQLADHADMAAVSAKIRDIKLDKVDPKTARLEHPAMLLHPMSRWHLYSEFSNGVSSGGAIRYVWLFAIIGIFVLLLACINFMNLSTARSEKRAREVGIRKAIGSMRGQLIGQFFSESILVAMLAFVLGLGGTVLTLPAFDAIAGKSIAMPWGNPYLWIMRVGVSLMAGVLAGLYPAFYLSSFQPVKVLKGFKADRAAVMPRRVLIVLQFTVSIVLIIGTIVVYRQVQFAKSRPLGYNRQGLITIVMRTEQYHNNLAAMRHELMQQGVIADMAESNTPITENDHFNNGFSWEGMDARVSAKFNTVGATREYGNTVAFQFLDGRDFGPLATDSSAVIINEAAAKYMGFAHPVGKVIRRYDSRYTVIGVVKDMVTESPYEPVTPTLIMLDSNIGGILNIRLNPNRTMASSLEALAAVCRKYSPEEPFDYRFADEEYARKFSDEERVGRLSACLTALAIFISCLGIFGMAACIAEQRVKEIGIRKVLGASTFSLWGLLSGDFVLLVMVSLLIATPIAYYCTHSWLQHYPYRAALSWWIFAAAGSGAMFITIVTVSFQSIRSAMMNPVKSLRSE